MPKFLPGKGTSFLTVDEWFLAISSKRLLAKSTTLKSSTPSTGKDQLILKSSSSNPAVNESPSEPKSG